MQASTTRKKKIGTDARKTRARYIHDTEMQPLLGGGKERHSKKDPINVVGEITISFKKFMRDITESRIRNAIIQELEVDLPRLCVLFIYDNITAQRKVCRVSNLNDFVENICFLQNIYNARLYFLSFFCTQAIFFTPFVELRTRYEALEKDIYLLDSEDSIKCVKLTFSKNCIFALVLGEFEQVDISDPEPKAEAETPRRVLKKIEFSVSCIIEHMLWPADVSLKWVEKQNGPVENRVTRKLAP